MTSAEPAAATARGSSPIVRSVVASEQDVVATRHRARRIAARLGFDHQDQIRIATAVSEVARNALMYAGGGTAEYAVEGRTQPQVLVITIRDTGPGIADLDQVLRGDYRSTTGMGLGIRGARRLMDQCDIDTAPGRGTEVRLKRLLPRAAPLVGSAEFDAIGAALATEVPADTFQEVQRQNQELMVALQALKDRQEELSRVNHELEDTNRGVVALYAELDEKAEHLERADRMKSRFLSNMSHEFRTPLHSILALCGLMRSPYDRDLDPERRKQVQLIEHSASTLLELVNDLLDLAKIEAGKVDVRPGEFEVSALFSALRGMLRPLLAASAVELIFEEPDGLPPLHTDEGKVSQILRNFLSNALKYTERGEIRVRAVSTDHGRAIKFLVSDTGIGIPTEDQARIFEEFTQIENPLQRRVKGTGLGLPLCRRLAELLGGSVHLESALGRGSTFWVTVPVRWPELDRLDRPEPDESGLDPSRIPVLVVEDDEQDRFVYQSQLASSPFQPIAARNLREAEAALVRVRPAAIVLDLLLRGEDSWDWLARLKGDEATREIPVLVASSVDDRRKALALGADAYFLKPVRRELLIAQLVSMTRHAAAERGADPVALVIDDEERERDLLCRILGRERLQVVLATTAEEGRLRTRQVRPDVVFLDLGLPDRSGFDVLADLRADPDTEQVPIVVVTSMQLTPQQRRELDGVAAAVLFKDSLSDATVRSTLAPIIGRTRVGHTP